jgi:multidrug efflux pump subunit AcrA (membrane-fusion protein)
MRREALLRTALCLGLLSASCGKSAQPEESVESVAAVVVRVVRAGPARIEVRVRASGTTVAAPGAEFAVTGAAAGARSWRFRTGGRSRGAR